MKVLDSGGKNVVWEVIEDIGVKDPKENVDIVLRGFGFNFFEKYKG